MILRALNRHRITALAALLAVMCGCTLGPDYVRPTMDAPDAYKEMDGWKVAEPQDGLMRGQWWEAFGDPELNALAQQVATANYDIAAAEARFRQARALVQAARAGYFPTVTAGAAITRSRGSQTLRRGSGGQSGAVTDYFLPVDASWELDLWGRVRRSVEANQANAQASAADVESVRLSAQTELAQNYFLLRALDTQKQLLDATVQAYERSLELTKNRYAGGVASRTDVAQAETQLLGTQAQALDVGVQRAQLEHAIAILIGKTPAELALPVAPLAAVPPPVPVMLPSQLLERRPDIASAERRVAAANAQIGIAQAAFYPTVSLGASAGFESTEFSRWLSWPSRFWSIGPAIAASVFDAGLRRATNEQARAAYEETVALYRQTVLTSFQEVEDNLAALRILEQEARVQAEAVKTARESVALTTNQYKAGVVSFLNVVVAQTVALSNERTAVEIQSRQLAAAVLLIKALGGGWDATMLPDAQSMSERDRSPASQRAARQPE